MTAIYRKPFLSYKAQIELLKSRGMLFADENKALHLLRKISYHRFSGYWYPLLADKQQLSFKPDVTFDMAFNLYKFDKELRKLILCELEKIEVAIRSEIGYVMSMAYGSFWMEDATLFNNAANYQMMRTKMQDEMERDDDEFILSFKSHYSNVFPPSFMALEITSFGTLLRLFNNLLPQKSKREIANAFGLSDTVFASWLHSLVYIRNRCAHHSRLWNREMHIQPLFPRKPANMWLSDNNICNNRMYYVLSMIIYLLNTVNPKHTFRQKLVTLFANYPNVDKRAMGFPADWGNELLCMA